MPSRLSVKHIPVKRKRRPFLIRTVVIISLLALVLLAGSILSLSTANELMRAPARPL